MGCIVSGTKACIELPICKPAKRPLLTPMIVTGTPFNEIAFPRTRGDRANRCAQNPSLMTTTRTTAGRKIVGGT
jgi:hypothetical protein